MTMLILFLIMVFLHCIMDYTLQGDFIANAKQKKWWTEHKSYKEKYKYDYIAILIVHGFMWSFGIHIPMIIIELCNLVTINEVSIFLSIIFNGIIHSWIDDCKANKMYINLIEDQVIHIIQIFITLSIFYTCIFI